MDEIHTLIVGAENEEERLLHQRVDKAATASRIAMGLLVLGTLLTLGMVCIAGVLTFSSLKGKRKAERELEEFFDISQDLFCVSHTDGYFKRVNPAFAEVLGWNEKEMLANPYISFVHPDDIEPTLREVEQQVVSGRKVVDFTNRYRHKDGSWRMLSWKSVPLPGGFMYATARDITRQYQAEQHVIQLNAELEQRVMDRTKELDKANLALKDGEARTRAFIEQAADAIFIHDFTGRIIEVNRRGVLSLGYTHEELLGMNVFDIEVDFDLPGAQAEWRKIEPGKQYLIRGHHRRKDGSVFPVELSFGCFECKEETLYMALVRDITDRMIREASHERLAKAVEQAAETIVITDATGSILYANPAFEKTTGYTAREALGLNPRILKSGKHDDEFYRGMWDVLKKGETWSGHLINRRKDGSLYDEEATISPVRDADGTVVNYVAVKRDVSQELKVEAQVRQMQKMESIGTLASGIAHDLNNTLAPILMALELLREHVKDSDGLELMETMRQSAQHGADLVKQVLTFARGVKGEMTDFNLMSLSKEIQKVIHDTFPKNIAFSLKADSNLWMVNADPTQIHQVLMNLCVNARDAMPDGGGLEVSLQNIVIDDVYAGLNPAAKTGSYVLIQVTDNGTGIPPTIRQRIFDPFFTTKAVGKGTGMGLSTVMSIVKSHGGFVNLYSELGKGSTFKVYLRAITTPKAVGEAALRQAKLECGHGETILIVDDEERVRDIAAKTLVRFGYQVLSASNGAEALALYAQHREKIALVLTDMAMPVMDGPTTIIALKAMNPAVKIIASSGLRSNGNVTKAMGEGVGHFIPKPYTAETMLAILARALKEKA